MAGWIRVWGVAWLVLARAGGAVAGAPMDPPDRAAFCARMVLQADGETLTLRAPVVFAGRRFRGEIRAGLHADQGRDVFGEILNLCGDRIARPRLPHE